MAHFWLALAVFVLLPAIGAVILFLRARELFRDVKRGGRTLAQSLDDVSERLERMSERAESIGTTAQPMEPSVARLRTSLTELAVLRSALQDVQDAAGRVTAVYPRK